MTTCIQEVSTNKSDFDDRSKTRTRTLAKALAKAATAKVGAKNETEGDAA